MNIKNILVSILLLLVIVAVGWVFFNYRNLVEKDEVTSPQQQNNQIVVVEDKKINDNTKPFSIDITYPFIKDIDGFNQKVESIIQKEVDSFKKNSLANDEAVKENDPEGYAKFPRQYDLNISYTKGQIDDNLISIIFNVYNFEGGAHGAGYFIDLNYDVKNNREIALKDLFGGQKNYLQSISAYAVDDLTKQAKERLGSSEGTWILDGAGPKEENFSVFLIKPDSITFYFPQYQVAPYAAGDFQVTMKRP